MQGRIKRDGGAAGDPEQRGGAGHDAAPPNAPGAETAVTPKPKSSAGNGTADQPLEGLDKPVSRIRLRNWRISTRLVALLTLPVVAATTLGALRIQSSLDDVAQLEHMDQLTTLTEKATQLADALQDERDITAGPLTKGARNDDDVIATHDETDKAARTFLATSDLPRNDNDLAGVRNSLVQIDTQLRELNQIRKLAYTNDNYVSQTANSYNQLISGLLSLSQDMAQATSNSDMIKRTRALNAFSSAKEDYSMQRAILAAGLAHKGGPKLDESDRRVARAAFLGEKSSLGQFRSLYSGDSGRLLAGLDGNSVEIQLADRFRDRAVNLPNGIEGSKLSYLDWVDKASTKLDAMDTIQTELLNEMSKQAKKLRSQAQRDALLNGAIILIVLGVAVIGAAVVARSMIRSLRRLQETANEVAQKRLPELVKHLSEADPQEIDTSVESIGLNSRDEIGQVARAFDEVHREAVRLASEQALLRGNVNAMFTNLSRRSQGLIQRQLTLISELESREADPDQLSSLFKLDHLATRMRRNGENLLVLAGEEPGRRWTRPVPLVDVLRAAASEVEQYERIELTAVPSTEVAGRVVNDLVYLLAELLENATSFSSPQTRVKVTGHALPDGRVLIEIHDTGIGLSPEDLADINERLASPPTVDVSVSRRMGLFVVGRLSLRHGIRIQLRPSDSGGTTALVMLPVDVTQGGSAPKGAGGRGAPVKGSPQRGQLGGGAGGGIGGKGLGSGAARPAVGPGQSSGARELPQRPGGGAHGRPQGGPGIPQQRPQAPGRAGSAPQQPAQPARGQQQRPQPQPAQSPQWARANGEDPNRGAVPPRAPQPSRAEHGSDEGLNPVESTVQFGLVPDGEHQRPQPPQPQPPQPLEPVQARPEAQLPPVAEPMALPPAPAGTEERTPIFDTMESDWFRTPGAGQVGRMQSVRVGESVSPEQTREVTQPPLPQRQQGATQPPAPDRPAQRPDRGQATPAPQRPQSPPQPARLSGGPTAAWRPSQNDERWRRAEQAREPQAGGVTPSGLPRRVPRANLVPGTAQQQQAPAGGPQVSRAPDEVRGRLTNLRRGIQQGRQAGGTDGRGFSPNHQER
ncbi:nitrate- and nitrite sensing domain-containing protein [Wenjunlia tyrosinilytica]|uniref:histidine kinase n=1 Tax=Wenjunlia tyrosinilytica TaxID=1544741 RepID=A0A918DZH4_9ACTN|nr:nitrate- and nitrite sensing domain-containing protein [Wenjunlia tyrosinilytica]GGO93917.1 histidine kinase [Wenjunlia tyrosinilytica]